MWASVKAGCLNSLTVAWGYCLAISGAALQMTDVLVDLTGDPNFKEQLSAAVGDTKTVGRILLGVSIVTILVRLRSIRKAS